MCGKIQELGLFNKNMETVVLDKFLVIGFGSIITLLLAVIGYFLKQSNEEMRQALAKINDHETRISVHDEILERHDKDLGRANAELAEQIVMKLQAAKLMR